ncbi:MAG: M48 family peptidase [Spirochaetaceae bacterium]|nr:MAG: M48 family peptidase [Spirochaetaceae bacterium]
MRRWIRNDLLVLVVVVMVMACATVPVTERRQLRLIPRSELFAMSFTQYDQFLAEHPVITGTPEAQMVERVGQRIAAAVHQYMREIGREQDLAGYEWEFRLVDQDMVNAWCMPGGKVVFYTGILPVTATEAGLAVVMGHEIAHAIAEHGNERMSQALLTQFGGAALMAALRDRPEETQNLWMAAFGAGAQVGVLLPFSRLHESEADRLGLIFMAMAGYDPTEAVRFWQRMADARTGPAPPELVSTHPADERRIRDLESHLPTALEYYRRATATQHTPGDEKRLPG